MRYRIKLFADAFGAMPCCHAETWLREFDPDGDAGAGSITTTHDPTEAKTFASALAAVNEYRRQSKVLPWRHDGKANRPLTAFGMELDPVIEQ